MTPPLSWQELEALANYQIDTVNGESACHPLP